jgi:hypothetical protein
VTQLSWPVTGNDEKPVCRAGVLEGQFCRLRVRQSRIVQPSQ